MKILLTGRGGQVGGELLQRLPVVGEVVAPTSRELDLADPDAIVRVVRELRPDLIVNPAAYTAVDKAESEPGLAFAVNGRAPGILAEEARRAGALLVHYSTDYVFDGSKPDAYVESDATAPLNVYGASKLAGEQAIAASGCRHLVFRTSWVYGATGKNFMLTMLRLMRERPEVRVVNDQFGAPTWSGWLAESLAELLQARAQGQELREGLYHMTPAGRVSWHGFAQEIGRLAGCQAQVLGIPATEYPTPARRPANSLLSGRKAEQELGLLRPDWRELLQRVLATLPR